MNELELFFTKVLAPIVESSVHSALQELQPPKKEYPRFVGVQEAAEITGYARNSLYQMNSRGLIPGAFKSGKKLLFRTHELLDWVERNGKCYGRSASNKLNEKS